jgi:hypothetical protein
MRPDWTAPLRVHRLDRVVKSLGPWSEYDLPLNEGTVSTKN